MTRPRVRLAIAATVAAMLGAARLVGPDEPPSPARDSSSSVTAGRFVTRSVGVDGKRRRYAVWLPIGYDPRVAWPAIVCLHGTGECGTDGTKPTQIGLGPALEAHPERWPFVVVFPQKPREDEEWEEQEHLVLGVLDHARKEFGIDPRRVAFTGMSQGGHGVWMIGARYPSRWTCLVPVCAYGRARTVATRVARLPVWAFHGLQDDLVNPYDSKVIVSAIREERVRLGLPPEGARLTLYPNANHNSWDAAYAEPELPQWIMAQSHRP